MLSHRILFIGELWHGNKTLQQLAALENLMHEVGRISTTRLLLSALEYTGLRVSGKLFKSGLNMLGYQSAMEKRWRFGDM